MKIEVALELGEHVKVPAFVLSPMLGNEFHPIDLWADTGASRTTILEEHAIAFNVDFSNLKQDKQGIQVVGGTILPYILRDVTFAFLEKDTTNKVIQTLKRVDVIRPTQDLSLDNDGEFPPVSIMGVDLLKRFHFDYNIPNVSLDLKKKFYVKL